MKPTWRVRGKITHPPATQTSLMYLRFFVLKQGYSVMKQQIMKKIKCSHFYYLQCNFKCNKYFSELNTSKTNWRMAFEFWRLYVNEVKSAIPKFTVLPFLEIQLQKLLLFLRVIKVRVKNCRSQKQGLMFISTKFWKAIFFVS